MKWQNLEIEIFEFQLLGFLIQSWILLYLFLSIISPIINLLSSDQSSKTRTGGVSTDMNDRLGIPSALRIPFEKVQASSDAEFKVCFEKNFTRIPVLKYFLWKYLRKLQNSRKVEWTVVYRNLATGVSTKYSNFYQISDETRFFKLIFGINSNFEITRPPKQKMSTR